MIKHILFFMVSCNVFALEFEEPPKTTPKIIHGIWVGPQPIPDAFLQNIKNTAEKFEDFDINIWTSQETIDKEKWPQVCNLLVHPDSDLQGLLCLPEINFSNEFAELLEYGHYTGAKDILQHILLYTYGGIVFDLDLELKETIREFINPSEYSYYCFPCDPALSASIPQGIYPTTALYFYQILNNSLKNNTEEQLLLENIKRNHSYYYLYNTTAAVVLFANRILLLKTAAANFHNESFFGICDSCQECVFEDVNNLIQTGKNISYYASHLGTPSSLAETEATPDVSKFIFLARYTGFMVFKLCMEEKGYTFYDCCSDE